MKEDEIKALDFESKAEQMKGEIEQFEHNHQQILSEYEDRNESINRLCTENMKLRNGNI